MRIATLDSIRGVAALVVVLYHSYLMSVPMGQTGYALVENTPLSVITAGRFAVIQFFVLSGFVLSLPYFHGTAPTYRHYIIRRFCRIYLPYLAVVLLAAALCRLIAQPRPPWAAGISDYFTWCWSWPVSIPLILSHATMSAVQLRSISLDPPIWSLIVEMRVSIIFPLLVMIIDRFSWRGLIVCLLIALLSLVISLNFGSDSMTAETFMGSIFLTIYYIPYFLLGILIASCVENLKGRTSSLPYSLHIIVISIIVFTQIYYKYSDISSYVKLDIINSIYCVYFILCCLTLKRPINILSAKIFQWLGKISYSLYLIHVPIMLAGLYILHDILPDKVIIIFNLPLIFIAAEITYRCLEEPSLRLGRRLTCLLPT